jgi:hypothetical protein
LLHPFTPGPGYHLAERDDLRKILAFLINFGSSPYVGFVDTSK